MKSADARQKRWGKRFRSVLAEIAGREFGGPPHRTPGLFSFLLIFPTHTYSAAHCWSGTSLSESLRPERIPWPRGYVGQGIPLRKEYRGSGNIVEGRPFQGRVKIRLKIRALALVLPRHNLIRDNRFRIRRNCDPISITHRPSRNCRNSFARDENPHQIQRISRR